ncbi:MAG TPA: wax ester/triacylglycerol synthase family O-acyltransferase [Solirubrobacteraceae bacterium]|nr:wax ester/triacylglycerol synthase family O-acyltransferase [Solirubrobacteraceae bacterium]
MASDRLSALDGSFLRLESAAAHMHVGSRGVFRPSPGRPRPTLDMLRASIEGRLRYAPRFRQRLAFPPAGLGEPFWVDDEHFDLRFHVRRLGDPYQPVSYARFCELVDQELSRPLDRRRPLWEVHLVPRLDDGRVGLAMKMHHAMVDGIAGVQLALLVFHASADAEPEAPDQWSPRRAPGDAELALRAVADSATESLRAARGIAGLAGSPVSGGTRIAGSLRRAALAVGDDLLRAAPPAYLNRAIGPQRTLVGARLPLDRVLAIKRHAQVTHNDVCLALVTGALRDLARRRGETPQPMRAMVPVSVRADTEDGVPGNRISFAFVDLPLDMSAPGAQLRSVHEQTTAFKRSERPAGTESVLSALRFAPSPVKTLAARLAGSARAYNLTVSNVPGPRTPIYMLGAELEETYPVVPLSEDHTLSVGIFTYADGLHFGLYAEPEALPEVTALPAALKRALRDLARATRPPPRRPRGAEANGDRRAATTGPSSRRDLWPAGHVPERAEA